MLHIGLDLSLRRIDVCVLDPDGGLVSEFRAQPDRDGLRLLASRFEGVAVRGVIESMTGARFVHDTLEGPAVVEWHATRVKVGAVDRQTDRIDARVVAGCRRDLIPAVWCRLRGAGMRSWPGSGCIWCGTAPLKNRIHSSLNTGGVGVPMRTGAGRRRHCLRARLAGAWRGTVATTLEVIDHLDGQIAGYGRRLAVVAADVPEVGLLQTAPGVGPVLGFTIASEIGDITRFPSPRHLVGYSGLAPRVIQSGDSDRRGPLTKHGPQWLRWALIEAAVHASRHRAYSQQTTSSATRTSTRPKSPGSTPPDDSPPPSGGCSPEANRSLLEAPASLWSAKRPTLK